MSHRTISPPAGPSAPAPDWRRFRAIAAFAVVALTAGACGAGGDTPASPADLRPEPRRGAATTLEAGHGPGEIVPAAVPAPRSGDRIERADVPSTRESGAA